jgi:hypothetical protein
MHPIWPNAVYCTTLYCTATMPPPDPLLYIVQLCIVRILCTPPDSMRFTEQLSIVKIQCSLSDPWLYTRTLHLSNVQIQCILSDLLLYPVQLSTGTVHPTRPTAVYCTAPSWIDMYSIMHPSDQMSNTLQLSILQIQWSPFDPLLYAVQVSVVKIQCSSSDPMPYSVQFSTLLHSHLKRRD